MLIPLGQMFSYKFALKNSLGVLIGNGSPFCLILKKATGQYWNGIGWTASETALAMTNLGGGLYLYEIEFDEVGEYDIRTTESAYKYDETFLVNVSSGEYALTGSVFSINQPIYIDGVLTQGLSPTLSIKRISDQMYLTPPIIWSGLETQIPMIEIGTSGIYSFDFSYADEEVFEISIVEATSGLESTYNLTFKNSLHESAFTPVNGLYEFSSETVLGTDGGSAEILDSQGVPVKGVKIEVHNKLTKEVFRAISDNLGKWKIYVPAGTYIIIVSHDDYKSVSIERQVG